MSRFLFAMGGALKEEGAEQALTVKNTPANFLSKMVVHAPQIKQFVYRIFLGEFLDSRTCTLPSYYFWTRGRAFYKEHLS